MSQINQRYLEVTAHDLPLTCPMPNSSLWNSHPRVRLALNAEGDAHCPYCGTRYKLTGELPKAHH